MASASSVSTRLQRDILESQTRIKNEAEQAEQAEHASSDDGKAIEKVITQLKSEWALDEAQRRAADAEYRQRLQDIASPFGAVKDGSGFVETGLGALGVSTPTTALITTTASTLGEWKHKAEEQVKHALRQRGEMPSARRLAQAAERLRSMDAVYNDRKRSAFERSRSERKRKLKQPGTAGLDHSCLGGEDNASCTMSCTYVGACDPLVPRDRIWTYVPDLDPDHRAAHTMYCFDAEELVHEFRESNAMTNHAYNHAFYPKESVYQRRVEQHMLTPQAIASVVDLYTAYIKNHRDQGGMLKKYQAVIDMLKLLLGNLFLIAFGSRTSDTLGGWVDWAKQRAMDAYNMLPSFVQRIFSSIAGVMRFVFDHPILTRILASVAIFLDCVGCFYINSASLIAAGAGEAVRMFVQRVTGALAMYIPINQELIESMSEILIAAFQKSGSLVTKPWLVLVVAKDLAKLFIPRIWCFLYHMTMGNPRAITSIAARGVGRMVGTEAAGGILSAAPVVGLALSTVTGGVSAAVGAGLGALQTAAGGWTEEVGGWYGSKVADKLDKASDEARKEDFHNTCPGYGTIQSLVSRQKQETQTQIEDYKSRYNQGYFSQDDTQHFLSDGHASSAKDQSTLTYIMDMLAGELDLYAVGSMIIGLIGMRKLLPLIATIFKRTLNDVPLLRQFLTEGSIDTFFTHIELAADIISHLYMMVGAVRIVWKAMTFLYYDIYACYIAPTPLNKDAQGNLIWADHCCFRKIDDILVLVQDTRTEAEKAALKEHQSKRSWSEHARENVGDNAIVGGLTTVADYTIGTAARGAQFLTESLFG